MSRSELQCDVLLSRFREHLQEERYSPDVARNYPFLARRFLRHLEGCGQTVESVSLADVECYLSALGTPVSNVTRRRHRAAIAMLLRLVHDQWPPAVPPTTAHAIATGTTVAEFDAWMKDLRGLSPSTRRYRRAEASWLMEWLHGQGKTVGTVTVADLDAYIAWRGASMRRTSIAGMIATLRSVLRYLHERGHLPLDLAGAIKGPKIYALEGIPSTIRPEDVERALEALEQDRSPLGLRDYAIWMLATTYGLRAGEIVGLRLSDIDWRHERLHIQHTKTGASSALPLLRGPADALFDYLRHGRPVATDRAVFLRSQAPYRALANGSTIHGIVTRRLAAVGVFPTGKHGAHLLRYSRAASLLRGGVSLKVIGDILGHRTERSTAPYLKLAMEDLRSVALDLPAGVAP
ncbi:site-specific integrase [uncultured Thiodictyon sp.]|uniref:site-specific integrase n=1 Tax=uncultured Thiodictyon sp. TaxID=1846217 RepID=UPI0025E0A92F|nr:site-specific integrase [uncultured Thiodictyon sp.]